MKYKIPKNLLSKGTQTQKQKKYFINDLIIDESINNINELNKIITK